ncbi:hypothetical protein COX24_00570 [bacterium (Candidatus Gribaldobacteria) CG23_combo_of_CG06-09_8_20_14_all_37_87_8]|uniref:DUF3800 domain-containing protein n=2 Tax=Candidatus Gribaldobacteria TaxID=2798536 RepID=A0A2G9ZFQ6_9BACT|nr:MAG: hypothetical protein AUJ25_01210 [Parcubacteria group bacterium CG1_02_37_13]PIP31994.1 MAG: hypothetical protein COX24_00570 [bacterium (Candidatus Gribaldobacteria) CG23_combo_of_CG06-09_8_20_14_all_37_87_8]PIR89846.1 MAG: hypothetical protein COU05_03860 [bacterium (Candidatus Gribaldobacteria) CG10_big_fil_rev_8_21_14_0_10_37_21]
MATPKQKLYCYVDESGQDTKGKLFLVSIIIPDRERDAMRNELKTIEQKSGKNNKKWTRAKRQQRESYIKQIIASRTFISHIYYSYYHDTKAYLDLTILSTAKAVCDKAKQPYEAIVFIDGLRRKESFRFGTGLRRLNINVKKVRGMRDESDEFIRLADAISGLVRDGMENDKPMQDLYKQIEQKKIVKNV